MNTTPYSPRRLIGATLIAWLAVIGFDFLLHGGLLARLYSEPSPFLLPPEQAFARIPLGYLSFLVFQVFLVWLIVRLGISGWRTTFMFGMMVGGLIWAALVLGLLSIASAPPLLMLGWFAGQAVEAGIGASVAALALATERPGRLVFQVLLFMLGAIVLTIVLQSLGLAPAARTVMLWSS
jgi:hypothetical protein